MKKPVNPAFHGLLDYALVALFMTGPIVFKMHGAAAKLCWLMGVGYFILAAVTAYPLGIAKKLSFAYHGVIDFYLAIAIVIGALIGTTGAARLFFVAIGALMLAGFTLTDFREMRMKRRKAA